MGINWKVRIKNKLFWTSLISALALLAQAIAALFGFTIDLTKLTGQLIAIVDAVFVVLAVLGIVADPTTKGVGDSERAMTYVTPWVDEKEE